MGYWSKHPMAGDIPLDYALLAEEIIINMVKYMGDQKDYLYLSNEENYQEEKYLELFKKYLNKYKYILIDYYYKCKAHTLINIDCKINFDGLTNEARFYIHSFVIPYLFIVNKIKLKKKSYIKKLLKLLKDGGSYYRGFNKKEKDSPSYYCEIIRKYKKELFLEDYKKSYSDIPKEDLNLIGEKI